MTLAGRGANRVHTPGPRPGRGGWEEIQSLDACSDEAGDCRRAWTAYLFRRDPAAARQALPWLENEAKRRPAPPWVLVPAHARQGEYDRSLDWLEYMLEKHEVWLITLKVNPLFDPLRTQPRFQKVMKKLHLTAATPSGAVSGSR